MSSYDRTARLTVAILVVICLAQTWFLYVQHRQVQVLVRVDCAALEERQGRVLLYDDLVSYWSGRDATLAASYTRQRGKVQGVIDLGIKECDSASQD